MHQNQPETVKKKQKSYWWIIYLLSILLILYACIGWFIAPKWIKKTIHQQLKAAFQSNIHINSIEFNPFTFNITANQVAITDTDQKTWLKIQQAKINLNLTETVLNQPSVSTITIQKPELSIRIDKDWNMISPQFKQQNNHEPSKFIINKINIKNAKATIQNENKPWLISDLSISTTKLDHTLKPQSLELAMRIFDQDNITLSAEKQTENMQYTFFYQVDNLDISDIASYLPTPKDTNLKGTIHLQGQAQWQEDKHYPSFSLNTLEFDNTELISNQKSIMKNTAIFFHDIFIDPNNKTFNITSIQTPKGHWFFDKNLANMFTENSQEEENKWNFSIQQMTIENHQLFLPTNKNKSQTPFIMLEKLMLEPLTTSNEYKLNTHFTTHNSPETISLTGTINPNSTAAEMYFEATNIHLHNWSKFIDNPYQITGFYTGNGQLNINEGDLSIHLKGQLTDMTLTEPITHTKLLQTEKLSFSSHVNFLKQTVYINCITTNSINGSWLSHKPPYKSDTQPDKNIKPFWNIQFSSSYQPGQQLQNEIMCHQP